MANDKKQGFGERFRKGFQTSSYITAGWEWFLSLAARLVQPVLFVTVMYNIVTTYPGFKTPWAGLDIISFIGQNAALDIGSFGLPKLADQAEQDGNVEGAEKARGLAKALFYILIINLVWGGVEHVFTGIPDAVKTAVGLLFIIVRAYYATEYMRVIHGLSKHEDAEVQGASQGTQVQITEVQALKTEVQGVLKEVQGFIQVQAKERQEALALHLTEVQALITEEALKALHVQGARHVQAEVQQAMLAVQAEVQRQVQGALNEVQTMAQSRCNELRAEVQITEIQEQRRSLDAPRHNQRPALVAPRQVQGATGEVQGATGEVRQGSDEITEVQGVGAEVQTDEVQGASDGEPRTDMLPVLHLGGASDGGFRDVIFAYVQDKIAQGITPSVKEVMADVGCKERTAKTYRKAALDALATQNAK